LQGGFPSPKISMELGRVGPKISWRQTLCRKTTFGMYIPTSTEGLSGVSACLQAAQQQYLV
jgi:hypothetical protein